MAYRELNGPALHGAMSVGAVSAVEVKVGASVLEERSVVVIQPLNGTIYFGFSTGLTSSNGLRIAIGQLFPVEATDKLPVYIIAETGTVDVRIAEIS